MYIKGGLKGVCMEFNSPKQESEIQFRDDVTVELIDSMASDLSVVRSAKVSTVGDLSTLESDAEKSAGLINFLMRDRHGTPFEHNSMTFFVSAPIFVFREFHRHRIASYNEESGRYKKLQPVFYVPGKDRNLIQSGKTGSYTFEPGTAEQHSIVEAETKAACTRAYAAYLAMLDAGIAREVARGVLPVSTFSSMYVTMNARSLMNFLSLRTKSDDSHFPSFPQREIEMVAEKIEKEFSKLMPLTHSAFVKHGRVSP
jgi:thymidylate synthase (FAD)